MSCHGYHGYDVHKVSSPPPPPAKCFRCTQGQTDKTQIMDRYYQIPTSYTGGQYIYTVEPALSSTCI